MRSFAYSECPLAGETEGERRERNGEMAMTGRVGETALVDGNSEKRKGRKNKTE